MSKKNASKKDVASASSEDDFEADTFEKNERKNWMFAIGGKKWGVRINPVSFTMSVLLIWGFTVCIALYMMLCVFAMQTCLA